MFDDTANTPNKNMSTQFTTGIDESSVYLLNIIGIGSNYSREIIIEWINQIVSTKCNAGNKSSNKI